MWVRAETLLWTWVQRDTLSIVGIRGSEESGGSVVGTWAAMNAAPGAIWSPAGTQPEACLVPEGPLHRVGNQHSTVQSTGPPIQLIPPGQLVHPFNWSPQKAHYRVGNQHSPVYGTNLTHRSAPRVDCDVCVINCRHSVTSEHRAQ